MIVAVLLGVSLIALAVVDLVITTLTVQGAGPLSSRVMRAPWLGLLAIHRRSPSHRMLAFGGVCSILLAVLLWVILLWAGWTLVFFSSGGAIVQVSTGMPADFSSHVYYAAFTLFTLGLGDYRPVGALWQILTGVCVANGLLALTLSVTYLVPVVSAAVEKRKLAGVLACLGSTPRQMLVQNWNGQCFGPLTGSFLQLTPLIIHQAQQHLAYPALHYFHSSHPETALAVRIAALDEALTLLLHGVSPQAQPERSTLLQIRSAIGIFLQVIVSAHIETERQPPAPLSLGSLEGIPTEPGPAYEQAVHSLEPRRRLVAALVRNDGWTWDDVTKAGVPEV